MTSHAEVFDVNVQTSILKLPRAPGYHGSVVDADFFWTSESLIALLVRRDFDHFLQSLVTGDTTDEMDPCDGNLFLPHIAEDWKQFASELRERGELGRSCDVAELSH